jgi:hypothetical protein
MRFLPAILFCLMMTSPVLADDPVLRPSAQLLFKQPELLKAGQCVAYREGGSGWVMTEPVFYLKGTVLTAEVRGRPLKTCPIVPGRNIEQYSREEFNRLAAAYPCLAEGVPAQESQIGMVKLRVDSWETPHARNMANAGRLYRGMFIDTPLQQGMELELEADLLAACRE